VGRHLRHRRAVFAPEGVNMEVSGPNAAGEAGRRSRGMGFAKDHHNVTGVDNGVPGRVGQRLATGAPCGDVVWEIQLPDALAHW